MKHDLVRLRENYANARYYLGFCNKISVSTKTRSMCMSGLNETRGDLRREIKRVAWLIWPATGKPATKRRGYLPYG